MHLLHRDPDWERVGVHAYHQCRCGARRVMRVYSNRDGPTAAGWPPLADRHGMPLWDSGWHKPPPGGWAVDGRDTYRIVPSASIPPPPPPPSPSYWRGGYASGSLSATELPPPSTGVPKEAG